MFKLVLISLATFLFLINAASQPKTFKLQFVTGSDSLVIWNDRHEDKFASHLFNIYSRKEKILPQAITKKWLVLITLLKAQEGSWF